MASLFTRTRSTFSKVQAVLLIPMVIIGLVRSASIAVGQTEKGEECWETATDLSASTGTDGWFPKAYVDLNDNLHVVWGGWTGSPVPQRQAINAVFYARWNGTGWSFPVEILASSDAASGVELGDLAVSDDGTVIIAWRDDATLMVSSADVAAATDPHSWNTVIIGDDLANPRLAVDSDNSGWYLGYVYRTAEVILSRSDDRGQTWSDDQPIWSSPDSTSAPFLTGVHISGEAVHIVWSEHAAQASWQGSAIWYARIDSRTEEAHAQRLSPVGQPDLPTMDWPVLAFGPDAQIVAVWNNGVGSTSGRFLRYSYNDGNNWSPIVHIFPDDLSGQTGQAGVTYDSTGTVHLVTAARGRDQFEAIRYASSQDGIWRTYETLWPEEHGGEHPALVITSGNRLHLVWNDYGNNTIVYSSCLLDLPAVAAAGFSMDTRSVQEYQEAKLTLAADTVPSTSPVVAIDRETRPEGGNSHIWLVVTIPLMLLVTIALVTHLARHRPH